MGEGVAKKEMTRRTGLSVPTVRKYLKMILGGVLLFRFDVVFLRNDSDARSSPPSISTATS